MSETIILVPKMYDLAFHRQEVRRPSRVYAETVPSFWPDQEGGRLVVIMYGTKTAMELLGRSGGMKVVCVVQPYKPYAGYEPTYTDELMCSAARRA